MDIEPDAATKKDMPKTDLGGSPCSLASTVKVKGVSGNVACCTGPVVSQCGAASMCNISAGWHLCTASEYLARYPVVGLPPGSAFLNARLAGCIRSGSAPYSPTDGVCACSGGTSTALEASWLCSGASYSGSGNSASFMGVKTSGTCHRVGVNSSSTQGYWTWDEATATLPDALCCK
jgi:hypothetical protein